MKILKFVFIFVLAVFIIIQFFSIDKTNPEFDKTSDLIVSENPPSEIAQIFRSSCYDCHSNETIWPWYSNIAPVSWMLKQHVEEGREKVNFSYWSEMEKNEKLFAIEEIIEEIELGEMPLPAYLLAHSNAKLTEEQQQLLIDWLRSQQTKD